MEVVPFKKNQKSAFKNEWTPEIAVRKVLDKITSGEIDPSTLIIAWTSPEEDGKSHEFITYNQDGLSAAIGLLEITKVRLTKVL